MKHKLFTFLLIAVTGLVACNKDHDNQPDIREFDEQQIQNYIKTNNLTGFIQDTNKNGGALTGMYYKIINQGRGDSLTYADTVSIVYSIKSVDGKYNLTDTIINHDHNYLGRLDYVNPTTGTYLPQGLKLAVHDILKYKGSSMRVIIPSHLAYGVNGYGTGSITNTNTRVAGNQSLDCYINVVGDRDEYDDFVIRDYMSRNNLSGYTKDPMGYYYKVLTQPTGTIGDVKEFSKVALTYVGSLLNGTEFDNGNKTTSTTFTPYSVVPGMKDALMKHCAKGTSISLFFPSSISYNTSASSVPANSILRFELQVSDVTQP
ncbi:FKBP-type peptidyl-prolyl cis-trans isomerase [Mucilaginibacter litoreus]|uniref:Peptidyl-prolyl cis-trans isomerase n=1 Tax=Mucilaginibacter litoreus TaxID=1048221 RepID=A0ABW3ASL4_9SPHI